MTKAASIINRANRLMRLVNQAFSGFSPCIYHSLLASSLRCNGLGAQHPPLHPYSISSRLSRFARSPIIPPLIPPFIPPLLIRIINIIIKPLHITDLIPEPARHTLRRILHIIQRIVEALLHPIIEAINIVLDILRDSLEFTDFVSSPVRSILREFFDAVLDPVFVFFEAISVFFVVVVYEKTISATIDWEGRETHVSSPPHTSAQRQLLLPSLHTPSPAHHRGAPRYHKSSLRHNRLRSLIGFGSRSKCRSPAQHTLLRRKYAGSLRRIPRFARRFLSG